MAISGQSAKGDQPPMPLSATDGVRGRSQGGAQAQAARSGEPGAHEACERPTTAWSAAPSSHERHGIGTSSEEC